MCFAYAGQTYVCDAERQSIIRDWESRGYRAYTEITAGLTQVLVACRRGHILTVANTRQEIEAAMQPYEQDCPRCTCTVPA